MYPVSQYLGAIFYVSMECNRTDSFPFDYEILDISHPGTFPTHDILSKPTPGWELSANIGSSGYRFFPSGDFLSRQKETLNFLSSR